MAVVRANPVSGSVKGLDYQANGEKNSLEVMRNGIYTDTAKEQHLEMRQFENLYQRSNVQNKRLDSVFSPTKEEIKFFKLDVKNDQECADNWKNYIQKNFEKADIEINNYPHIAHIHRNTDHPHAHIKNSLTDFYGENKISPDRIGERMTKANQELCKEHGLKTTKEIGEEKRGEISKDIREILEIKKVSNFEDFKAEMYNKGYLIHLMEGDKKGIYGMRIIPSSDYAFDPSKAQEVAKQGWKLSEIPKNPEVGKAKFNIQEIKNKMEANQELTPQQQLNKKFSTLIQDENIQSFEDFNNRTKTELTEYSVTYAHSRTLTEQKERENSFSRWKGQEQEQEFSPVLIPHQVSDIRFEHKETREEFKLSDLKNDKNESYSTNLMQEQMKENRKRQVEKTNTQAQEQQKQKEIQEQQNKYAEFMQREQNRTFNQENNQDKGLSR